MDTLRHTSSELQTHLGISSVISSARPQSAPLEMEDLFFILQIDPNDSLIALELARRLESRDRCAEALRVLNAVLAIDYRFETVHALAQLEYKLENYDSAFTRLNEALLLAPEASLDLFDLFKTLGNVYVRRGEFDLAEDNYNRAHRINSDSDALLVNFGTLYVQKSDWDEAAERFREALRLNRTNDKAWIGLAICHRSKSDVELAWGNLEAALTYNPINETALGLAIDWSLQEGRDDHALESVRKYLVAGGWSEKMSLAFAWLSWRRGNLKLAKFELERLLAVNPSNTKALELAQQMRIGA